MRPVCRQAVMIAGPGFDKKSCVRYKSNIYLDATSVSYCQCPFTFRTFSITSRTQPQPPLTGEIYFTMLFTSLTASAGHADKPTFDIKGISGRSSPIKRTSAHFNLLLLRISETKVVLSLIPR